MAVEVLFTSAALRKDHLVWTIAEPYSGLGALACLRWRCPGGWAVSIQRSHNEGFSTKLSRTMMQLRKGTAVRAERRRIHGLVA